MVVMKNKRYLKSKSIILLPILSTPLLILYKKLLRSFFTFIDVGIAIYCNFHNIFNFSNDTYNFNNCYIYGNKD